MCNRFMIVPIIALTRSLASCHLAPPSASVVIGSSSRLKSTDPFQRQLFKVSGGGKQKVEEIVEEDLWASVTKTAAAVGLATAFGIGVGFFKGKQSAVEFFAGYLVEQSLSVDNLFVFILLFEYFKVPPLLQERALKWGVIGAVLMRGIMIGVGVAAVQRFRHVTLLFAGILLISAIKLLGESSDDEHENMSDNGIIALARKLCDAVDYFDGDKFFTITKQGRRVATPLLLCVICIELSDFVFAVDSIPAVLAVSKDPFIVYSSNVFAIAALRSLYAVLATAIRHLPYLRPSVALILGFVGVKMLMEYFHRSIDTTLSLAIIIATLAAGVIVSLVEKQFQQIQFNKQLAAKQHAKKPALWRRLVIVPTFRR